MSRPSDGSEPVPPASVAPCVRALGADLAARPILSFGGAELCVPSHPRGRGRIEALLGADAVEAPSREAHLLPERIPFASRWLARYLWRRGLPVNEIARLVRATDVTVRRWLREKPAKTTRSRK